MIGQVPAAGESEEARVARFKESVLLMGTGSAIAVIGTLAYGKLNAFKCFLASVGGVIAARGLIRFIFK